jgi:hypothetical protein
MEDLFKLMPQELKNRITQHGLHKVASAMYGVDVDVGSAARIIGEKLAARRAINHEIMLGLKALSTLK